MRIAICDDDRNFCVQTMRMASEELEARSISAEIVAFSDAKALLKARDSGDLFDAYLLDIILPDIDGIALAKELRETQPKAPIVFLTTSKDYSLKAFSLDAAHYLLKPIQADRLAAALDRLLALLPKHSEEGFAVKIADGSTIIVDINKITRAKSDGHYWVLYMSGGDFVRCRITASELRERLSATGLFVSANKSDIISIAHVCSITSEGAVLANGETISLSRRAMPDLREAYLRFNCH